jgi:hypothetical protein
VGTLRVKFDLCPTGPLSLIGRVIEDHEEDAFGVFDFAEYEGTYDQGHEVDRCCCEAFRDRLAPLDQILVVREEKVAVEELFKEI